MRRRLRSASLIAPALLLAFSGYAGADTIGFDRNGDITCDSNVDMGVPFALPGVPLEFTLTYTDLEPNIVSGCVFCVQDSLGIDPASAQWIPNAGVGAIASFYFRRAHQGFEVHQAIPDNWPRAACWIVGMYSFSCIPVTYDSLGTFRITPDSAGCVGLVIDATNTAILDTSFTQQFFDDAFEMCDAYRCPILTDVEATGDDVAPARPRFLSVEPNPFNPKTTIRFELEREERVTLSIHDAVGRRMTLLHDGALTSGTHAIVWDGLTDNGTVASSGIYFVRYESERRADTRKLVLLR